MSLIRNCNLHPSPLSESLRIDQLAYWYNLSDYDLSAAESGEELNIIISRMCESLQLKPSYPVCLSTVGSGRAQI